MLSWINGVLDVLKFYKCGRPQGATCRLWGSRSSRSDRSGHSHLIPRVKRRCNASSSRHGFKRFACRLLLSKTPIPPQIQKIQNGLKDTDRWEEAKDCGIFFTPSFCAFCVPLSVLEVYLYPCWPQTEINTTCVTRGDKFYMSRCVLVEHASLLCVIQSLASLSARSFDEKCRGMYFLPRPSCGYCLPALSGATAAVWSLRRRRKRHMLNWQSATKEQ